MSRIGNTNFYRPSGYWFPSPPDQNVYPPCQHVPIYTAPCLSSNRLGEQIFIQGYCTLNPDPADCEKLGYGWGNGEAVLYKDNHYNLRCTRTAWPDNYEKCCLLSACFSDQDDKMQCNPEYQTTFGPKCKELFHERCVVNPSGWTDSDFCARMMSKATYTSNAIINQTELPWIREEMRQLFENYFTTNNFDKILLPGSFQYELYQNCKANSPACYYGLSQTCQEFNRDQAYGNLTIADFCGCHMNPNVYAEYNNLFGISPQCDPLCGRSETIRRSYLNGDIQYCNSNVCIIDDIAINIADSQGGDISFDQLCSGCTFNTKCNCRISSVNIDVKNGSQVGNINLNQECTGSLNCTVIDPDNPNGPALVVPCTETTNGIPTPDQVEKQRQQQEAVVRKKNRLIIFIMVIILIGFIFIMLMIFNSYSQKLTGQIIEKKAQDADLIEMANKLATKK